MLRYIDFYFYISYLIFIFRYVDFGANIGACVIQVTHLAEEPRVKNLECACMREQCTCMGQLSTRHFFLTWASYPQGTF